MSSFYGEYNQMLDAKNRMRLPAKFRGMLGNGYVILNGANGCLMAMESAGFNAMAEKFSQVPMSDIQGRKAITKIMASVVEPEEDAQGRFVLPQKAKGYAGITKNIIVTGAYDHVEIWAEERYNELGYNEPEDFNQMLSALEKYGI
ncbi:MAG: hypothetical protein J6V83_05865 [Clostridia bacterium]|nr:hypothetical protein [Clostridia bacterium]MBO7156911.1 hypothetical protein [Clostridia bacterium]